jgi:hypothetical protein
MLSIAQQVEVIIIDIDNCDLVTKQFATLLLMQPNTHNITTDELTPYQLISRNRIYNLDWMVEQLKTDEDDEDVSED